VRRLRPAARFVDGEPVIVDVPDDLAAEVDDRNRVTLKDGALRSRQIICMETLEPALMSAVTAFEGHGDVDRLREDLRRAADPGSYDGTALT
jgi:hypothetical protein